MFVDGGKKERSALGEIVRIIRKCTQFKFRLMSDDLFVELFVIIGKLEVGKD